MMLPILRPLAEASVSTAAAVDAGVVARHETSRWARTGCNGRVAAEHSNTGAVLGSAKRYHVLPDVRTNEVAVLGAGVGEDVLDQVIAELITSNCSIVSRACIMSRISDLLSIKGMRGRS